MLNVLCDANGSQLSRRTIGMHASGLRFDFHDTVCVREYSHSLPMTQKK